jgi:hypothetical protein
MFDLAQGYRDRGMAAYSEVQERKLASEAQCYTATRHQREVGTGYFGAVAVSGGTASTTAMAASTETAQFKKPAPKPPSKFVFSHNDDRGPLPGPDFFGGANRSYGGRVTPPVPVVVGQFEFRLVTQLGHCSQCATPCLKQAWGAIMPQSQQPRTVPARRLFFDSRGCVRAAD